MPNFFSDTQTVPSQAMRETVLTADVGDEQSDADPTTNRLCERVAELLGKDAAVFLPSGTMCNEIAINVHCSPGEEVICARQSHIIGFEGGGPAALSGVMMQPIDCERGIFSPEQVAAAVRTQSRYAPRSRLCCVEQTVNVTGGAVWPVAALDDVAARAKDHGLATHMDGARLMNAVVASGVPAADHAAGYDTVWIDFTKGLGAPIGAVLAGSKAFIDEAWQRKQRWGGAMRQSGVAAAMCLYALDHNIARLAQDHDRAVTIAQALQTMAHVECVVAPETNIVFFDIAETGPQAEELADQLAARGIRIGAFGRRRVRLVTHMDVDDSSVAALLGALAEHLAA